MGDFKLFVNYLRFDMVWYGRQKELRGGVRRARRKVKDGDTRYT